MLFSRHEGYEFEEMLKMSSHFFFKIIMFISRLAPPENIKTTNS